MRKIILGLLGLFTVTLLIARDIKTNDGQTLKHITITKITPIGLEVMHSGGGSFVKFENLSKALQNEFHYDKVKAEKYTAELELKKQKAAKALAAKQQLKELKRQQFLKQQKQLAKQQQEFKHKQRSIILKSGIPVVLSRRILYPVHGKTLFASAKVTGAKEIFLAYNGYMLVNNEIYLVKNNTIDAEKKLAFIKNKIDKQLKVIAKAKKDIAEWEKTIDTNIDRIDRMLGRSKTSKTDYYDKYGRYIGSGQVEEELSKIQLDLIRRLDRENRRLDKDIDHEKKNISTLEKQLLKVKKAYSTLTDKIQQFKNSQPKVAENKPKHSEQQGAAIIAMKSKLSKLKEMFEQGLIPKEVYHNKVSKLIDLFIGKIPNQTAPAK